MMYKLARFLVNTMAPIFGMFVSLWLIWNVEMRFFPVVTDFKVSQVISTADGYMAYGELRKARSCEFLGLTIYAHSEGEPKLLIGQFKKDIFGSDVGTGHQTWGPWTMAFPPAVAQYDHIQLQGTHRCHALWMQTTEYFSMSTKDLPR